MPVLAASLSLMSPLGVVTARRIAHAEGADLETGMHDGGCEYAAAFTAIHFEHTHATADNVVPLIRPK